MAAENNWKTGISIGVLLHIGIALLFVAGTVFLIAQVYYHERRVALIHAEKQAEIILKRNLATHAYFAHDLKPDVFALTDGIRSESYFEPSWMSSTYAVRGIDGYFKEMIKGDYYYKECAVNSRSPENEADPLERAFIEELNRDPELEFRSMVRKINDTYYFVIMHRGEVMEESCLLCHSSSDTAPQGMVAVYGPERSFHRSAGDVVSAISIRVPLDSTYADAAVLARKLSLGLLLVFSLLFVCQYFLFRWIVGRPLAAMRDKALEICKDDSRLGESISLPVGRELHGLAAAFNAMSARLRDLVDNLEEKICERTERITRVNTELQEEIGHRQQIEETLRKNEERFRLLYENAPLPYQSLDAKGCLIEVNQSWLDSLGYSREEVIGRSFADFLSPEWQDHFRDNFPRFKDQGEVLGIEFELVRKDGSVFPARFNGRIGYDQQGNFKQTHCVFQDITVQRLAEDELRNQQELLEGILRSAPVGIGLVTNRIFGWTNRMMMQISGYSSEELDGQSSRILYPDDEEFERVGREKYAQIRETGTGNIETKWQRKDGVVVDVFLSSSSLYRGDISKGVIFTALDITTRKQTEKEVIRSKEEWEKTFNALGDIITIQDKDLRIVRANRAACSFFEKDPEQIVGKQCYRIFRDISEPCPECPLLRTLADINSHSEVIVHQNLGKTFHVSSAPIFDQDNELEFLVHVAKDITEQDKLEKQLMQAQKMEAVGQLAGGVAHDFNNILAAIINYGHLMLMKPVSDDQRQIMGKVLASADRAAKLTSSLLAFSRKQVMQPSSVRINELIERMEQLISRVIGENIEIRSILTDKDPVIMADSTQIEQVLLNLATNARDAMPEGGVLTLATEEMEMDAVYITTHGYGEPGRYALVTVSDTGKGMDEETLKKIFEPFFTTKEVGKGTGLGLAMSYGIIKQHKGFINFYSEPGKGTTVKIYLPVAGEDQETATILEAATSTKGKETVLLAEDDKELRVVTRQLLEGAGYQVIEAADGQEAVEKFQENRDWIEMLILDAIMPNKGGKEAYDEIRAEQPEVKVLFLSGYTADTVVRDGFLEQGLNFISKPVAPAELMKKIRGILDK